MAQMVTSMTQKPRILMVDDEPDILAGLRRTLRPCGFDLTCTSDPRVAIDLLGTETFDIVISDIDMPGIDGHALMERARALQPTMIRIFLTATASMGAAVRAINEGEVHRFVPKPFEAGELRRLLQEALDRKSELDIASEASTRAGKRQQLHSQLEAEHPGITKVVVDERGVYVVDMDSIEELAVADLPFARRSPASRFHS
jgi:two-component system, probable response regulator PhcQ